MPAKVRAIAGAVVAILGLFASVHANAKVTNGSAMPAGSYVQTCTQQSYDPTFQTLKALCTSAPAPNHTLNDVMVAVTGGLYHGPSAVQPSPQWSNLNVAACDPSSDILNLNGRLQCQARAGTWGAGGAVPSGSYQQSCDMWEEQTVSLPAGGTYPRLAARCKTFTGDGAVTALLNLSGCSVSGDIQNDRGALLCAPGQNNASTSAPPSPGACRPGFVPRLADAADKVCVTLAEEVDTQIENRQAAAHALPRAVHLDTPDDCQPGYVWRRADVTDYVCVSQDGRAAAQAENAAAAARMY